MKDIRVTNDYDLEIAEGDFVIEDALVQNQSHILQNQPGELKQYPYLGAGVNNWLLDEQPNRMVLTARKHLEADGMRVSTIELENNQLTVDASY